MAERNTPSTLSRGCVGCIGDDGPDGVRARGDQGERGPADALRRRQALGELRPRVAAVVRSIDPALRAGPGERWRRCVPRVERMEHDAVAPVVLRGDERHAAATWCRRRRCSCSPPKSLSARHPAVADAADEHMLAVEGIDRDRADSAGYSRRVRRCPRLPGLAAVGRAIDAVARVRIARRGWLHRCRSTASPGWSDRWPARRSPTARSRASSPSMWRPPSWLAHTPPPAAPTQILSAFAGSHTRDVQRPPMFVGPTISHCDARGAAASRRRARPRSRMSVSVIAGSRRGHAAGPGTTPALAL